MLFSTIPPELLLEIFSYHNKSDIKSVRLVCRDFHRAASQYLFERIYLSPHRLHLQILQDVSQHPIFSKYVREIVYDASYFDPDIDNTSKYQQELSLQFKRSKAGDLPMPSEATVSEGFLKHRWHVIEQENYTTWKTESNFLRLALPLLPKVDQISLIDDWDDQSDTKEQDHRYYSTPLARQWHPTTLKPVSWCHDDKLRVRSHTEREARFRIRARCFLVLARALEGVPNCRIRHLIANQEVLGKQSLGMPLGLFKSLGTAALQSVSNTFRTLTTLNIEIMVGHWLDGWDVKGNKMSFTSILTAATGLESLKIGFGPGDMHPSPDLDTLLGGGTWKSLRVVKFWSIYATEDGLLAFLERHRSTLRQLSLESICLESNSWPLCLDNIKSLSLQLDVFCLDFASDVDHRGLVVAEYPQFRDPVFKAFLYNGGLNPLVGAQRQIF
ncbi:MAG: hypothetical protein M1812_001156 [Candelaria pacifica]|nr:MAG: hypothetical protein M1812_001156 [Candelaria pacifica]